jgi:Pyruvate/2-oxoacid:ferredoxin oxidoreductase delta subunit
MYQAGEAPPIPGAFKELERSYSNPFFWGAPRGDALIALLRHMYTNEQAEVVRHLKPWIPRRAAWLARKSRMPIESVNAVLHELAHEKYLVPGTFESVLIRKSTDSVTPWHKRFAELYEELVDCGYVAEFTKRPIDAVRYLPVGEVIRDEPAAWPSDHLEVILDRYKDFAIGVCQCRLSKQLTDEGCGRMLETCTLMGSVAPMLVEQGRMKQASRQDVLDVKAAAEKEGLVTWMMNEESGKYANASCSCCGCCCGALRTVTQFNSPGFISKPHFMPHNDAATCTACGKCEAACPMKAFVVFGEGKQRSVLHKPERCIGCGLCAVACPKKSLVMKPVPDYQKPPAGWSSYLLRYSPNYFRNALRIRASRR